MPSTPPTESQILHSYLLHPSPLPTIIPYTSFLSLLPKSSSSLQQTHSTALKHLYRDLEFQRDVVVDDVRRRIEGECTRTVGLTARLTRQVRKEEGAREKKRKRGSAEDDEGMSLEEDAEEVKEMHFDTLLHDGVPLSNTIPQKTSKHNHSTTSLLTAMETATQDLHSEVEDLEAEIERLRGECEDTIGGLSDLRYGRFSGARGSGNTTVGSEGGIEDDVVEELKGLKRKLEDGKAGG